MSTTEMATTEMATTFRRAAEVIRTGGLVRGSYRRGDAHCTIGALMAAKGVQVRGASLGWPEIGYLAGLLGDLYKYDEQNPDSLLSNFCRVTYWNDACGRTADDVTTLLEQAAEKLEAEL